jgi:uncharacterized protein (DUF2461 family)
MNSFRGFRPEALAYLRALKKNNRREWFEERREQFVRDVSDPMKALIEELDVRFADLAPDHRTRRMRRFGSTIARRGGEWARKLMGVRDSTCTSSRTHR